ncbi:MAG: amidohydrolase family protein [Deltaproteobacteria bacterium]|nr:amidohydrolase family protein [Deltaproteobacteria bacterium]
MRALAALLIAACHGGAPPAMKATVAIVDVTVVPMDRERELAHQTVLVDGDHIVAVGLVGDVRVAAGVASVDGRGHWLIPGLYDMHVHLNEANDALLYVANGVTTVRNMWGGPQQLGWREQARRNDPAWLGPSIITAGPIVDGDPPVWPGSKVVTTPEAAVAEVDAEKAAGYDFVKVYENLTPPVYDAIAAEAKRIGMRFAGHVPQSIDVAHAMASGQASIEHLTGYVRGTTQESQLPSLAAAARSAGTANTPTLIVMQRFAAMDNPAPLMAQRENRYVSPQTRSTWDPSTDFRLTGSTAAEFAAERTRNVLRQHLVKLLSDGGAIVFAGTDAPNPFVVPGFALHEELAMLVAAGLTPYQALRAATAVPAEWLGRRATITPGAPADLVLLDADPLRDIAATRRRSGVLLRGIWFPQPALDAKLEALATAYEHPTDPLASAPPLAIDPPSITATYTMTMSGHPIGRERLAVHALPSGGRVIVAQGYMQPASTLTTARIELDAQGRETTFILDGKGMAPAATDDLFDGNLLATMIPFADRAAHGTREIHGRSADDGSAVTYTFEPAGPRTWRFTVTSKLGTAPGTYAVDADGLPTRVTLQIGGELAITRD